MSLITATLGKIAAPERRTMAVVCGAHVLHDGYTDLLYVLLPLWQAQFGLGYAEVGVLRALYVGAMAGFQIPAGSIAQRFGGPLVLGLGTALAGVGYLTAGASAGFAMLVGALVIGGLGSGVQHPIGAHLVSQAFSGARSRQALAGYNFSGDLGKMAFPAATAWLLTLMNWRTATTVIGIVGLAAAAAILAVRGLPTQDAKPAQGADKAEIEETTPTGRGFPLLLSIAMIDSATRMGFLTFLPFLLRQKGADLPMIGVALTLVFTGGAAGKLACGWLGARLGVIRATWVTEGLTALGILALLPLPLFAGLAVLPLIGMALNGTSSVLYGTVPELVAPERRQRAFSVFYTGGVGAGALSPVLYGAISDLLSVPTMMVLVAVVVLTTLPLAWGLRPALREIPASAG
ncbi:MAG: MFS transporter [Alphaproteobacteria bacterium]|nr:MFS transporter [Alphaproteobacteria bacterium]MBV9968266.1 MFS transporter [Alphaproteobacteria bacterium]